MKATPELIAEARVLDAMQTTAMTFQQFARYVDLTWLREALEAGTEATADSDDYEPREPDLSGPTRREMDAVEMRRSER